MTDVHSPMVRSKNMAAIRGRHTKPEKLIRSAIFAQGLRYRLYDRRLPGRPDIVLSKHRAIVLVHGCFWHRHCCPLFKWPKSNVSFWRNKIDANARNDIKARVALNEAGWRVLTIWECSLKGKARLPFEELSHEIGNWIRDGSMDLEITGTEVGAKSPSMLR